jgi:hypothetical protein
MHAWGAPLAPAAEAHSGGGGGWLPEGGSPYGAAAAGPGHGRMHSIAETVVVHPGPNSSTLLQEQQRHGGHHHHHGRAASLAGPPGYAAPSGPGPGQHHHHHGRAMSWAPDGTAVQHNRRYSGGAEAGPQQQQQQQQQQGLYCGANPFAQPGGAGLLVPPGKGEGGGGPAAPLRPGPGSAGGSARRSSTAESLPEGELCVICLSSGREVGLLHGASVHMCVCKACAPLLRPGQPCPMCRQPIERIIGVF